MASQFRDAIASVELAPSASLHREREAVTVGNSVCLMAPWPMQGPLSADSSDLAAPAPSLWGTGGKVEMSCLWEVSGRLHFSPCFSFPLLTVKRSDMWVGLRCSPGGFWTPRCNLNLRAHRKQAEAREMVTPSPGSSSLLCSCCFTGPLVTLLSQCLFPNRN